MGVLAFEGTETECEKLMDFVFTPVNSLADRDDDYSAELILLFIVLY